jgi:hypothetical protein
MGLLSGIVSYFLRLSLLVSSVALGVSLSPNISWIKGKFTVFGLSLTRGVSLFQSIAYTSDEASDISSAVSFYSLLGDTKTKCLYSSNVATGLVGAALALNLAYFHIYSWKKGNLNIRFATSEVSIVTRLSAFLVILSAIAGEVAAMIYFYNSQCIASFSPTEMSSYQ